MTTSPRSRAGWNRSTAFVAAAGWTIERVMPPSRLYCANGIRAGADGRIYVAQVSGSQISAIHPDSGDVETIVPMGGDIVGPDDLAFDEHGNMFVTEITEGRVSMVARDGSVRVIQGDMPVANPVTVHQGRLFAGECRPGARIMELDRDGGAPRVILADVPLVNAFEVGPDGKLYFPVMGTNEIWRVDLAGGAPEIVVGDLGHPDSVKFDPQGNIVSTQVATGEVLRIDPQTGARTQLARLAPGLDNSTFVGDRLFVSRISGEITEILANGDARLLIPDGLQWPLGLAVGTDGTLFVADGGFCHAIDADGAKHPMGMLFAPGFPGYVRGAAAGAEGEWIVTAANGEVARYWPGRGESEVVASGYEELYGVARAPDGRIAFVDYATGRALCVEDGRTTELARGLDRPKGIAFGPDGGCYATETGGGRVVELRGGRAVVVLDGLLRPEGIVAGRDALYLIDVAARLLLACDASGARTTVASRLPVGAPPGVTPRPLRAFQPLCGALGPFAALAMADDGTIYVGGDAEGSVLKVTPQDPDA